jgi:transglutaminase-like putative cysteine protease
MKFKILLFLFFSGICTSLLAQEQDLSIKSIPAQLLLNANSILREEQITVNIEDVDRMTITTKRTTTVLNKYGDHHISTYEMYDNDTKIRKLQAVVYNAAGKEIKKYRQKDFKDRSAVASGTLYSDNRVQYLDHTPQEYPYTIVYESEVRSGSTVFIQPWAPVSGYFLSVQKSTYNFQNPKNIAFRIAEKNLGDHKIQKREAAGGFTYTITELPAYRPEYLSPDINKFLPGVRVALNEFSLVGVKGKATNWDEFGKWQYDYLLAGKNVLPAATIQKISELTRSAKDDVEKARIIYQYVQDNTRYISVQLGIGGWEPMLAGDVDKLGYGDCKALTNYTKALLDSQMITSHYAVVFGGDRKDLDPDFASMQGNHVILNIPQEGEDIWLECTSQTTPFNYLGDFTDNRHVLLVKADGGEIVKTKTYSFSENIIESYTRISLDDKGSFMAEVSRKSEGIPYGNIYDLDRETRENQVLYYKNDWGYLQSLDITEILFENNRKDRIFTEKVLFNGQKLTSKAGNRLLLPTNFFTVPVYNVPRTEERKLPFEIERGHFYKDTFVFHLPKGFETESIPQTEKFENPFGKFSIEVHLKSQNGVPVIEVIREYILYDGVWPAEMYPEFRDFMNRINTLNNQKAVIIATT